MAMNFKEIVDSGFFHALMRLRADVYNNDFFENQDKLMYELCRTRDERIMASRDEIKKLTNKIRKKGTDALCLDYLELRTCVDEPLDETDNDSGFIKDLYFWEDYFTDYFLENIDSLTPMTDDKARLEEKIERQLFDQEYFEFLACQQNDPRDRVKIMKGEEEIMQKIELDIEGNTREKEYVVGIESLKKYIRVSKPLELFFNISDSLILLRRLKKFERILDEDLMENELLHKPADAPYLQCTALRQVNDITPKVSNGNLPHETKTTADFLIGSEWEKSKILKFIKTNYSGEKGKSIAIMISALKEAKMICYDTSTKLYSALRNDFGNIGTNAGINKQMTDVRLMDKELKKTISLHAEKLRKHMEAV